MGPTQGSERDRLSEDVALPKVMLADDPLLVAANPCLIDSGSYSEGLGVCLPEGLSALHARVALPNRVDRDDLPDAAKILRGQ